MMASSQAQFLLSLRVMLNMKIFFLGVTLLLTLNLNLVISFTQEEPPVGANSSFSSNENTTTTTTKDELWFRLPKSVIPEHYRLQVIHILDAVQDGQEWKQFTAPGQVWIDVQVEEAVGNITLHTDGMTIRQVNVFKISRPPLDEEVEQLPINRTLMIKELQFFVIHFNTSLPPGRYRVYIEFVARIADDRLNGLYLDYYFEPGSKAKRYLATTLFSPTHARKAFPCFDEPALRATFNISIGHRADKYFSLSNMPALPTNNNSSANVDGLAGYVWSTFETTPAMPTYIVAMITTDFKLLSSSFSMRNGSKVDLQVYTPKHLMNYKREGNGSALPSTEFAHQMTKEVMQLYENYFQEDFPLPKLATISLPHFFFAAMENWGLITFKDPALLSISNVTTEEEKAKVAQVLAHELSHQYFGNLVGISWWDSVWLKEGFSTFFSAKGMEWTLPQFHPETHRSTQNLQIALHFDASLKSHPLQNQLKNGADVEGIFTPIDYEKGASVLRMVEAFMTPATFQKAIQLYIQRMKYKSATAQDFFAALASADGYHTNSTSSSNMNRKPLDFGSGITIQEIMSSWTTLSGFPVISVELDGNRDALRFTQRKFENPHVAMVKKLSKKEGKPLEESSWWVPVTLWPKMYCNTSTGIGHTYTDIWLPAGQDEIFVDYKYAKALFLVNPYATGYYRVLYNDTRLFTRIQSQLQGNHTVFGVVARSQLIDDYFALSFAQYTDISNAMNLTLYLDQETELVVWTSVLDNLEDIYNKIRDTPLLPQFKNYILKKLAPAWNASHYHLKDTQDTTEKIRLHSKLLQHLCLYSPGHCSATINKYFDGWMKVGNDTVSTNNNSVPADIQETLFCTAVVNSPSQHILQQRWSLFRDLYDKEIYSVQKYRYLKAVTCTQDLSLLQQLLNWTVSDNMEMHDVDKTQLVKFLAKNPLSKPLLLPFFQKHFHKLYKNNSVANPVIEGIKALTPYLNTEQDLQSVDDFLSKFSSSLTSADQKTLKSEMDQIRVNILWLGTFSSPLKGWLEWEQNYKYNNHTFQVESSKHYVHYHC